MTPRDIVIKTLNREAVDRVPRDLWLSAEVEQTCSDELAEVEIRFPRDIIPAEFEYAAGKRSKGKPGDADGYTDAWGCGWSTSAGDAADKLETSPLSRAKAIASYELPLELIESSRHNQTALEAMNRACASTNRFVLAETQTRPFDRLLSLRGRKATIADLGTGTPSIRKILAMLHDFFCQEMEMWSGTEVDGVVIGDDWGADGSLEIDPTAWRELFRPLYREYCKIVQAKDKFVFFRADGNLSKVFGELVRLEFDAIHGRLTAADFHRLAKRYRGQVTFWGQIDSDRVLSCNTAEQIRETVLHMRSVLDYSSGGVIAQCAWKPEVPLRKITTFFEPWLIPLSIHAAGDHALGSTP